MGGAALNPEVERIFKKIKFPYLVGYGMTEACPLLAYEHWTKYVPGSCGKPVDVAEVRIDSDDPQNTVGEIQARGENITIGYYNNPEATANAFTEDGWLKTGDLGPGTGKSMLANSMVEYLPKGELQDIIAYHNPEDFNEPRIRVLPAGKGKPIVTEQKLQAAAQRNQKNNMVLYLILGIVAIGII